GLLVPSVPVFPHVLWDVSGFAAVFGSVLFYRVGLGFACEDDDGVVAVSASGVDEGPLFVVAVCGGGVGECDSARYLSDHFGVGEALAAEAGLMVCGACLFGGCHGGPFVVRIWPAILRRPGSLSCLLPRMVSEGRVSTNPPGRA